MLAVIILATQVQSQTNIAPVRLAIVSESSDTVVAADLLAAEFSKNDRVQLLERTEIERVIREQHLSLNNLDNLKLGHLLGADGLLALQSVTEGTNIILNAQMVAVKPGVILTDERFGQPARDASVWSANIVGHLEPLLPKLGVLPQDAIPISVVNFHSGVRTAEAAELERQIFFLTVERLVRENRLFVLERKRMQALSEENELSGAAVEPFWNGKYLLDGVIDRNGFNPDVVTISARLIPPGGSPVLIEVSGSRTNGVEVVNQLAGKVLEALKLEASPAAWNTVDEADKFFKEAQWCLGWGMLPQAQAAVESAWALGKQDDACAKLRIKSYLPEVFPNQGIYNMGSMCGAGNLLFYDRQDILASKPVAAVFKKHPSVVYHAATFVQPDPESITRANHLLTLYYDCVQHFGEVDEIKTNSDIYALGINVLVAASKVLQQFYFVPESQTAVANELAESRALARVVAAKIEQSPSIHDSYYSNIQMISAYQAHTDFYYQEYRDIFSCELDWGSFWQETPEDCIANYKKLMESPNFIPIHERFWLRDLINPPLTAWKQENRARVSNVWKFFVAELDSCSNVCFQLEGRSLEMADAETDSAATNAFYNLTKIIYSNLDLFVTNAAMHPCLDWQVDDLVFSLESEGSPAGHNSHIITPVGESLRETIKSEFRPKIAAANQGYQDKLAMAAAQQVLEIKNQKAAAETQLAFEKQKQFLKEINPSKAFDFVGLFVFGFQNYSRSQALEIQPLLANYKTNITALWWRRIRGDQVEGNVEHIIHPDVGMLPPPPEQIARTNGKTPNPINPSTPTGRPPWLQLSGNQPPFGQPGFSPNRRPDPATEPDIPAPDPLVSTNIITVKDFYPLPQQVMPGSEPHDFKFTGQRLIEGKLLLDFQYNAFDYSFDKNGNWQSSADKIFVGMAVFYPNTRRWTVAVLPDRFTEPVNFTSQQSILWRGNLYSSHAGKIQKYDSQKQAWQPAGFAIEGGRFYNLDGLLYRADYNSIQEITENGHATKVLASIERQPPVSSLDSQGALVNLTLFVDTQKNLCVAVHNKIFRWEGNDWHEIGSATTSFMPVVFDDGILFSTDGFNARPAQISCFEMQSNLVELCLSQTAQEPGRRGFEPRRTDANTVPKPLWKLPAELSLPNFSAAMWQSDLFLMADHSEKQDIVAEERGTRPDGTLEVNHVVTGETLMPKDGYDTALFCFSRDLPAAHELHLKFEASDSCPPMAGIEFRPGFAIPGAVANRAWMQFTTNLLLCGRYAAPANFKPGIWVASLDSIASEANALKQMQFNARLQEKAKDDLIIKEAQDKDQLVREAFLKKFDLNHNGIIDPEEQDAAREDPYFIKYYMAEIRAKKESAPK